MDMMNGNAYGASQNLYVQPPTRQSMPLESEKSNLMPRTGRSRNPLLDVSLTQLDRPASPLNRNLNHSHESIGMGAFFFLFFFQENFRRKLV